MLKLFVDCEAVKLCGNHVESEIYSLALKCRYVGGTVPLKNMTVAVACERLTCLEREAVVGASVSAFSAHSVDDLNSDRSALRNVCVNFNIGAVKDKLTCNYPSAVFVGGASAVSVVLKGEKAEGLLMSFAHSTVVEIRAIVVEYLYRNAVDVYHRVVEGSGLTEAENRFWIRECIEVINVASECEVRKHILIRAFIYCSCGEQVDESERIVVYGKEGDVVRFCAYVVLIGTVDHTGHRPVDEVGGFHNADAASVIAVRENGL